MKKIAYVGVDYHLNVLAIASVIEGTKKVYETIRFKNKDKPMATYLKKLSETFELKLCYEASSNGYSFQRKVRPWGYHCDVIARPLFPRKVATAERMTSGTPRTLPSRTPMVC